MKKTMDFLLRLLAGMAATAVVIALINVSVISIDRYLAQFDVCFTSFRLNDERNVVAVSLFRDGHVGVETVYAESTDQGCNPVASCLYSGNAPVATSYDPRALYAGGEDTVFSYNRGRGYGDWGTAKFDETGGIMTVDFYNGVTSWVDADGVIASAYAESDGEVFVAFYDR